MGSIWAMPGKNWGPWGGLTPSHCQKVFFWRHKNGLFASKFHMEVKCFFIISKQTWRYDSGPIWAFSGKYWGSWGGKTPPNKHKNDHFWMKIDRLTLKFQMEVNYFLVSQRGLVSKIWGPYEPSPAIIEGPVGCKTPPNLHKNDHFLAKNRPCDSKISYGGQFFSPVSEGTCG